MSGYFINTIFEGTVDAPKITEHAVAPLMHLNWEPVTNKCSISFSNQRFLVMDGNWVRATGMDNQIPTFTLNLSDDFTKCWAYEDALDPVTGARLDLISTAGVMEIIKHAFEQGYDAEYAKRYIPTPPPEEPNP